MEKMRILRKRFFKKNQKEILELRKTINALRKKKKNKQTVKDQSEESANSKISHLKLSSHRS